MEQYSVLMSVYHKAKADELQQSMESIFRQTVPTDDFVLVCNGPLTEALDAVIANFQSQYQSLHPIHREKMGDLGSSLNIGIQHCTHELVARMDSDDISRLDRCERQLKIFEHHPELSMVSGTVEEFSISTDQIEGRRILPETNDLILKFARKRNPFNHPCIMYKKSAVEEAGGYQDFYLLEDYYLWVRMLMNGCLGYNVQDPLLWMRAGEDMYKRRSGWDYAKSQKSLFKFMRDKGFITNREYVSSTIIRAASSIAPNWLRATAFKQMKRTTAKG